MKAAIGTSFALPEGVSASLASIAAITNPASELVRQLTDMNAMIKASSAALLLQPDYLGLGGISKTAAEVAARFGELNTLQQSMFNGIRAQAAVAMPEIPAAWLAQNRAMQATIGGILSSFAERAVATGDWEDLDYGAEMGEMVLTFGEQLLSQLTVPREAFEAFVAWLERMMVIIMLLPKHKAIPYVNFLLLLLGVFSDSIGVGTFVQQQLHPTPEPAQVQMPSNLATREDVTQLNQRVEQMSTVLTLMAAQAGESRRVVKTTLLKAKPITRSFTIGKASKGTTVIVLLTQRKWAYISCQDRDNQPIHGWVMKKYLAKL